MRDVFFFGRNMVNVRRLKAARSAPWMGWKGSTGIGGDGTTTGDLSGVHVQ